MKEVKEIFPDYHDEDFLAPKSGAKLASLFDLDRAESQGDDSFQFIAPRQPKRTSTALGPPPQMQAPPPAAQAVLLATAVHGFCFVNGQYVKQGKLGAAILGNHVNKRYKILLYDSQQKQITTARIHHGFVLTIQPDNYTSFYDDRRQNWSLKFDPENVGIDFCKEVCVARWNSQAGVDTPVTQDLLLGEGRAVDVGDAVKISLTGWLLQSHAIGQMFTSSVGKEKLQRMRLGSGTVLRGLEQGMLGMQKGGRRLLILPANVAYGSQGVPNGVPPASTVAFDVEICCVKSSKDGKCFRVGSATSRVSGLDVSSADKRSVVCDSSERGGQAMQIKSGAVNVLPAPPDAARAKLISRMAKMGQPMLPFLTGALPAQPVPSHSEQDAAESGLGCDCPTQAPSPPSSSQAAMSASSPSSPPPGAAALKLVSLPHPESAAAVSPQQSYPIAQPFPSVCLPQHMPCYAADVSSFLLTEARKQDTDIRLSIARVADKVDQMATKVDEMQKRGASGLPCVPLEAAIILHNIQRIIQENTSLKKEVMEKASTVEEQNHKMEELIEQKQRYMEQSNLLLEQKNDALQNHSQHSHDRLLRAEEEKARLAEELVAASSHVCELQQEVGCLQQRATELQAKLGNALQDAQSRCALIRSLEAQVEELKNEEEHCRQQWRAEKQTCRKLALTVKTMEEELQDLRAEKDRLDQILSDRKRRWQLERERFVVEQEEQRRSYAQTHRRLLEQLRRLELEWHRREAALEQQGTLAQPPELGRHLEEVRGAFQREAQSERQQREAHTVVQVKRMMNELFHSLRVKFEPQDSYTGDVVITTLLYMIKRVTMRFLKEPEESESESDDDADEEEEEEEEEYLSAEETQSEEHLEKRGENGGRTEKDEDIPARLDKTFDVTTEETFNLEACQLTND